MNFFLSSCLSLLAASGFLLAAPMQVTALHPLMADLARQVGGERVTVYDLVGEGGNPHRFEPRPADMQRMQGSAIVLASGKNLETYLTRLQSNLPTVTILEVGQSLPSLASAEETEHSHTDEHDHAHGALDPHWWQNVDLMRRAARIVALAFGEKDAANKDAYLANAAAYGKRLDALQKWAKGELSKVPQGQRKLVTAHHAFAYFAKEFGFQVLPISGLSREQSTAPQDLAKTIAAVQQAKVSAAFPERGVSPKALEAIARATGIKLGEPLIADGNGSGQDAGFEGMIRHNVTAITQALATP